jgi:thiamine biosynthesis lipoprotein
MKRILSLLTAMVLTLSLAACAAKPDAEPQELSLFAMDTYMTLLAYGDGADQALSDAGAAINALESSLSRTREGSDVWTVNTDYTAQVSEETADLVSAALDYSHETGGAFDPTIAPLVETWGITTDSPRVPSQEEIDTLLPLIGTDHVTVDGQTVRVDPGSAIDLGGIAKGYASDRVAALFAQYDVSGTVSLGGNVYVRGTRTDGKPWNVAVQDPHDESAYACVLALSDAFVVTSGGYQRYFTGEDGTVYQHILDPATGYPVQGDLLSVTIVDRSGTRADAYSTALYVMGEKKAVDFWRSHGAPGGDTDGTAFDMVLVTADGRVLYTEGLQDALTQPEGSSYDYQLLSR